MQGCSLLGFYLLVCAPAAQYHSVAMTMATIRVDLLVIDGALAKPVLVAFAILGEACDVPLVKSSQARVATLCLKDTSFSMSFRSNYRVTVRQQVDVRRWIAPMRVLPITAGAAMSVIRHYGNVNSVFHAFSDQMMDMSLLFHGLNIAIYDRILPHIPNAKLLLQHINTTVVVINPPDDSSLKFKLRIEVCLDCTDQPNMLKVLPRSHIVPVLGTVFFVEWHETEVITHSWKYMKETFDKDDIVRTMEHVMILGLIACSSTKSWQMHCITDGDFKTVCARCTRIIDTVIFSCPTCACAFYCSDACRQKHEQAHMFVCKTHRLAQACSTKMLNLVV